MTTRQDFTPAEWELILEAPPSAGMIVIMAQHGGAIRETISMGKAYAEARQHHGASELLDEIVGAKPEVDHTRYGSPQEFKEHALGHLRDAAALLSAKATPQELEDYKRFIANLAEKVAGAHREGHAQDPVGEPEREAIDAIVKALG
jgi:hypothetical protein